MLCYKHLYLLFPYFVGNRTRATVEEAPCTSLIITVTTIPDGKFELSFIILEENELLF